MLEILDVTTALFEFVGRMADQKIFTNYVGISVELAGIAGRQLAWRDDLNLDNWCQEDSIAVDNTYAADEIANDRRELAVDVAIDIYASFGWENPSRNELEAAQQNRFGQPLRFR